MASYKPELVSKDEVLDLTEGNRMKLKPSSQKKTGAVKKRFEKLKVKRDSYLERARRFARYTVPHLYPEEGTENGDGTNTTGWQSFGADCAISLQNQLVMTLFPPHSSFARLELTRKAKQLLKEEDISAIEQEGSLVAVEKEALLEHERISGRVALGEAMLHLMVGGSTCLYVPKEGAAINYPLTRYVNRFDKSGQLLELIIEESKDIDTLPPAVQAIARAKMKHDPQAPYKDDEVEIYTRCYRKDGFFHIEEEVLGERVGNTYRVHPDNLPFIPLHWKRNYGEDYGRSLVEMHAGDFHVVQVLSEAIAKGMILMSDIKYLIKPGSVTDIDHLIESDTGEFVYGNIDDIGVLQLEKYADFTPIATVLDKYERRLGRSFMLGSAVQRDAERVTAVEIRRDALEMEKSLGGIYSLLSAKLQRPYFKLLLQRVDFDLGDELVETVLLTGIEALSKMTDADKQFQWAEAMGLAATLPEPIQARMKWGDYSLHVANQLSLELPFIMTEDEYAKEQAKQAAAQQQAMMAQGMADAIPQMAQSVMNKQGV